MDSRFYEELVRDLENIRLYDLVPLTAKTMIFFFIRQWVLKLQIISETANCVIRPVKKKLM